MIYVSLELLTLIAGLVAFVVKYFSPNFPLDEAQILAIMVSLLGAIGIVPQAAMAVRKSLGRLDEYDVLVAPSWGSLLRSTAFWALVAGIVAYIIHQYLPDFPLDGPAIAVVIVWLLSAFDINPQLEMLGLKD